VKVKKERVKERIELLISVIKGFSKVKERFNRLRKSF